MSKFGMHVSRRDSTQDHIHAIPNGSLTGGELLKPSSNRFGLHTHLYELDGRTIETSPAYGNEDHVHTTEIGETSGMMPPRKDSEPRKDYVQRRGSDWVVLSESGHVLGKHPTKEEADRQLRAVEANKAS